MYRHRIKFCLTTDIITCEFCGETHKVINKNLGVSTFNLNCLSMLFFNNYTFTKTGDNANEIICNPPRRIQIKLDEHCQFKNKFAYRVRITIS